MTSEVMVPRREGRVVVAHRRSAVMDDRSRSRSLLALGVLVPFFAYSVR